MKCPNCDETLAMTERQGIEIDYCPKCRGVWLDKGELDKIIEKSMEQKEPEQKPPSNQGGGGYGGHHGNKYGGYGKHGKRGYLGNLFDF